MLLALAKDAVWIPSNGLLLIILIIGSLITAGVALSVLTFYEDHYWNDKDFRERLRFNSSRKRA